MDAGRWVEHAMDEARRPDDGIEAERSRPTEDVYEIDEALRLEDVIGGRVLGWIGGLALLVGLVYFLVIATSRGWIGEEARVAMAAGVSLLLLLGGAWMHERRGRTEAALIAAATGVAGLFAATVVAGPVSGSCRRCPRQSSRSASAPSRRCWRCAGAPRAWRGSGSSARSPRRCWSARRTIRAGSP